MNSLSLSPKKVLVTGATSQIGPYLIDQLLAAGYVVGAVSRNPDKFYKINSEIQWYLLNPQNTLHKIIQKFEPSIWINSGSLDMVSDYLKSSNPPKNLERVIATGSTGIFSKVNSNNGQEREMTQRMVQTESAIQELCEKKNIHWSIIRPTLIYADGRDKNISVIVAIIKKIKFFPIWGGGKGLRQPVHAEDLATAMFKMIQNKNTFNKSYNLSGGKIISYKEMVEVIFQGLNKKPRVINVPFIFLNCALKGLAVIPRYRYLNAEMIKRMNKNLDFSHEEASRDFGYSSRGFTVESVRGSVL